LTDALGNLVRLVVLPGLRFDTIGVAPLITDIAFDAPSADKAFDANSIIEEMNQRGAEIVISQRPQQIAPLDIDADINIDIWRHLIETVFAKRKEFNGIAMRVSCQHL
jgi:hypothetical protein